MLAAEWGLYWNTAEISSLQPSDFFPKEPVVLPASCLPEIYSRPLFGRALTLLVSGQTPPELPTQ